MIDLKTNDYILLYNASNAKTGDKLYIPCKVILIEIQFICKNTNSTDVRLIIENVNECEQFEYQGDFAELKFKKIKTLDEFHSLYPELFV